MQIIIFSLQMAGLIRSVLIPASKRAHQGMMGMLTPTHSPTSSPKRTLATAGVRLKHQNNFIF